MSKLSKAGIISWCVMFVGTNCTAWVNWQLKGELEDAQHIYVNCIKEQILIRTYRAIPDGPYVIEDAEGQEVMRIEISPQPPSKPEVESSQPI